MLAKVTILLCHQLPFHPHSAMGFFPLKFFFFSNMWHGRFGEVYLKNLAKLSSFHE
jgi:hypothetical protein